ncbi:unnamed protein product [Didymodactylos carnosus]|uniref:FAR1 domain-containing protein n=1 Tax=Didymodactylos carnosus TaxID=1234261 RepID=A0A814XML1_9BILA|nr:unnamed protein product [Didymodactylos carnosus]CAF1217969.1 unnamed protein product [Didymodactylos carnosus]CAF3880753.1 unnamed protein product [Didymodactylos carnosus]CAF3981556.1 unnamed protein product [Didymodactylos carnosus]
MSIIPQIYQYLIKVLVYKTQYSPVNFIVTTTLVARQHREMGKSFHCLGLTDVDKARDSATNWTFHIGDAFHTFEEFTSKLNEYSSTTSAVFSMGCTTRFKSKLIYKAIEYNCWHGGKQRKRSKSLKPHQHHMALDCEARIPLYNADGVLKTTKLELCHDH